MDVDAVKLRVAARTHTHTHTHTRTHTRDIGRCTWSSAPGAEAEEAVGGVGGWRFEAQPCGLEFDV